MKLDRKSFKENDGSVGATVAVDIWVDIENSI
jgi:hypothetical protein